MSPSSTKSEEYVSIINIASIPVNELLWLSHWIDEFSLLTLIENSQKITFGKSLTLFFKSKNLFLTDTSRANEENSESIENFNGALKRIKISPIPKQTTICPANLINPPMVTEEERLSQNSVIVESHAVNQNISTGEAPEEANTSSGTLISSQKDDFDGEIIPSVNQIQSLFKKCYSYYLARRDAKDHEYFGDKDLKEEDNFLAVCFAKIVKTIFNDSRYHSISSSTQLSVTLNSKTKYFHLDPKKGKIPSNMSRNLFLRLKEANKIVPPFLPLPLAEKRFIIIENILTILLAKLNRTATMSEKQIQQYKSSDVNKEPDFKSWKFQSFQHKIRMIKVCEKVFRHVFGFNQETINVFLKNMEPRENKRPRPFSAGFSLRQHEVVSCRQSNKEIIFQKHLR